jgi:hypothetical protein
VDQSHGEPAGEQAGEGLDGLAAALGGLKRRDRVRKQRLTGRGELDATAVAEEQGFA